MRNFVLIVIAICIVLAAMDVATFVHKETEDKPSAVLVSLTEPAPHRVADPKANGYFLLLGFSAGPSLDAVQTGFDIWVEAESDRGHLFYDYLRPGRVAVRIHGTALDALQTWNAADPEIGFKQVAARLQTRDAALGVLLDRYQQWLVMPFEDWGYGHLGGPRFAEMFLAHRLYVATGFIENTGKGVERVARDLSVWRSVLAKARTLPLKLMAAVVVDDDASLAAGLLARHNPDRVQASRLASLARPLNREERSLRWPVQNEFLTALSRYDRPLPRPALTAREETVNNKRWLAALAGLEQNIFERVEHPLSANVLARGSLQRQRANNTYARYYQATIMAADLPHARLPRLKEFLGGPARGFVDYLVNPVDNVFDSGFEPDWQPFIDRILETDARLRLLTLQGRLREVGDQSAVHRQVAEAGNDFYDPFSRLPMLLNSRTHTLYSVGRDRRDDDGDPQQDIAVTLSFSPRQSASH